MSEWIAAFVMARRAATATREVDRRIDIGEQSRVAVGKVVGAGTINVACMAEMAEQGWRRKAMSLDDLIALDPATIIDQASLPILFNLHLRPFFFCAEKNGLHKKNGLPEPAQAGPARTTEPASLAQMLGLAWAAWLV